MKPGQRIHEFHTDQLTIRQTYDETGHIVSEEQFPIDPFTKGIEDLRRALEQPMLA